MISDTRTSRPVILQWREDGRSKPRWSQPEDDQRPH